MESCDPIYLYDCFMLPLIFPWSTIVVISLCGKADRPATSYLAPCFCESLYYSSVVLFHFFVCTCCFSTKNMDVDEHYTWAEVK